MAFCPFCKSQANLKLAAHFDLCRECNVAIRDEKDMPSSSGTDIYDDSWVRSEEEMHNNFVRASFTLKQIKNLRGVKRVLDIGSGAGILVDILNQNGYTADGVDSSPAVFEFVNANKKGKFYLGSEQLESIPKNKEYDLIIAAELIEHLRGPSNFLSSVKRHLKEGGYLYIETPNLDARNTRSVWRRWLGGIHGIDHRICYKDKSLSCLLQIHGFDVSQVLTKTFSPTIYSKIAESLFLFLTARKRKVKGVEGDLAIRKHGRQSSDSSSLRLWAKSIHQSVIASSVINPILFLPNRISELGGRGVHLIIIARNIS